LNREKANPLPACDLDDNKRQKARNLPSGLKRCKPRNKASIVGLWDGGAQYHCGVYHPTGFCTMRGRIESNAVFNINTGRVDITREIMPFCTVCRYVLVDLIDPRAHAPVESEYSEYYPEP
jgi:hypothetical protein